MNMDYKKIIKNQNIRFAILNALGFLPDALMLKLQYYIKMGYRCNLKNPIAWTEKLQLYKMYYRNPILGVCVDKYEVRQYLESKGLEKYLVQLYDVYEDSVEININDLPDSFVLKTTCGGGGQNVILIQDKASIDIITIKEQFSVWKKGFKAGRNSLGREWAYSQIDKFRIIAEELLVNNRNPESGIEDFKILCFSGVPRYIIVDKDRYTAHKRNFYDTEWNRIHVTTDHEQFETPYPRPTNLAEMLKIATLLSEDFPFVRVDLYNVDGKIYFGELTFYPWSGYVKFVPQEFDRILGGLFDISSFVK